MITDESIMPYGKHQGEKMANVPADYLIFMFDAGYLNGSLAKYVKENMDALRKEMEDY